MDEYTQARAEFDAAFKIFNPVIVAFTDIRIPFDQRPTWEEWEKAKQMQREAVDKFDAAFAKITS